MNDAAQVVERLLSSDKIHAFVLVCEAADKYMPMIDSVAVVLANGRAVKVSDIDNDVAQKTEETRKTLHREDRIIWALRLYKKSLLMECQWLVAHEPQFFQKKFGSPPAPEQPALERQIAKLADVDVTPFQIADPDDPDQDTPPFTGFATIDAINGRLGHAVSAMETYGKDEAGNIINRMILTNQPFGEVVAKYRRGENELMKRYAAALNMWSADDYGGHVSKHSEVTYRKVPDADMCDEEGPIKTVLTLENGWRWFDLLRNCSYLRDEMLSKHPKREHMATGHCGNTAAKGDCTILTLDEPLGGNRWTHHAFFVLYTDGELGERKGKFNQKPSPKLHPHIYQLLLQHKGIKGLGANRGYGGANDFQLEDLPPIWLAQLKKARPELFHDDDEPVEEL